MRPEALLSPDAARTAETLRAREEAFAVATVVRTAGATAAKPGSKALLRADGSVIHGWLGGGCTRSAVTRAVQQAMQDGVPQLISVTPEEGLSDRGVTSGDERDGVRFVRNGCPSEGTIDIFIEPCVPQPQLILLGTSPVAQALGALATQFGWDLAQVPASAPLPPAAPGRHRAIVVATQGQGDLPALKAALSGAADYCAFVGSQKKFAALAARLQGEGLPQALLNTVRAPAGLDISAVTPEEIALSILAELTKLRRSALKAGAPHGR